METAKNNYLSTKHYLYGEKLHERLLFSWLNPLLKYGAQNKIDEDVVPEFR